MASDGCKCVSAVTLVTLSIFILICGLAIYIVGSFRINGEITNGGDYLPEYKIDYSSFAFYVFISAIACLAVFILGLATA